jgi:mono/diheme cytochrome c family protein
MEVHGFMGINFESGSSSSPPSLSPPRKLRFAAIIFAAFALPAWSGEMVAQQAFPEPVQNALAGSVAFRTKGYSQCHSINGLGGTEAPDLGRRPATRTFFGLAADMWNHIPAMRGRMSELGIEPPHLDSDEIATLIAFLYLVHYFDAPGDTAAGRALFVSKRCVTCHQIGGIGGTVGPSLDFASRFSTPVEIAAAMWNHARAMAESMEKRGIERSTFTGPELGALSAYLRSTGRGSRKLSAHVLPGSAGKGRKWFRAKSCATCHGVQGRGTGRGPDLARRGREWSVIGFAAAMWNKAPTMMAEMRESGVRAPRVTASQMADIVAYLYSLRYFEESGDPSLGRVRIREKRCLDCHSLDGEGRGSAGELVPSPDLDSPAAVIAALWNHILIPATAQEEAAGRWPAFEDQEMADVVAFFQAQR